MLVPLSDHKKAFEMIKAGEADAFADLLYQTAANQPDMPGTRIVPGAIGHNALAIGSTKDKPAAAAYVKAFTETAIKSGFVAKSIEKAGVRGAAAARDVTAFLSGAGPLYPRGICRS